MKPLYKRKRFWFSIVLGVGVLWFTFHKADLRLVYKNLQKLDPRWLFLSFGSVMVSYGCIAAILQSLLKASGYKLKLRDVFGISLISTVANYVINFAGVSGLAVKIYLMSKRRILPPHTLSISIVHGFFTNTIAIFFMFVGLIVFYGHYSIETAKKGQIEAAVGLLVAALVGAFVWIAIFIGNERFRRKNWDFFMRLYNRFSEKARILSHKKSELEVAFTNFNESMNFIVKDMKQLFYASLYALGDWVFMFLCLKTSFLALHCSVKLNVLAIGFCVSLFVSVMSIVPGGLGVMEGSMVSIFYILGLEYEISLIAVILYRLLYYFLPILGGLALFLKDFAYDYPPEHLKSS